MTDECWEDIKTYKTRSEKDPKHMELKKKLDECLKEKQMEFMKMIDIDEGKKMARECLKKECRADCYEYMKDFGPSIGKFIQNIPK